MRQPFQIIGDYLLMSKDIQVGVHDGHNASVALLIDGKLLAAYQEERFVKEKNFDGFPSLALAQILQDFDFSSDDVTNFNLAGQHQPRPMNRNERIKSYRAIEKTGTFNLRQRLKRIRTLDELFIKKVRATRLNAFSQICPENKINFFDHHECHAAAAAFGGIKSEEKLILTNDGSGDRICASVNILRNGALVRIAETSDYSSIGQMYAIFTYLFSMVPLEHEYKMMGMAPYATGDKISTIANEFHSLFDFSHDGLSWNFNKSFSILESIRFFRDWTHRYRFDELMAGLQLFVEEFLTHWVLNCIEHTGISNLALSGGTFMNVKLNQKIRELEQVSKLFIFPSCGDETNAIGAAYLGARANYSKIPIEPITHFCLGPCAKEEQIAIFTSDNKFKVSTAKDINGEVAKLIAGGEVVGRFQGREEFGARSLGNRALLARCDNNKIIKVINEAIKSRDFWMPFACSINSYKIAEYLDMDDKNQPYYMIMTYHSKQTEKIIAGTHPYDKTARPQSVTKEINDEYFDLIKKVENLTGVAAVLNTSLNLHGLPLVSDASDLHKLMLSSDLKYTQFGNYLIEKI